MTLILLAQKAQAQDQSYLDSTLAFPLSLSLSFLGFFFLLRQDHCH